MRGFSGGCGFSDCLLPLKMTWISSVRPDSPEREREMYRFHQSMLSPSPMLSPPAKGLAHVHPIRLRKPAGDFLCRLS